jgi:hypothetical protein
VCLIVSLDTGALVSLYCILAAFSLALFQSRSVLEASFEER